MVYPLRFLLITILVTAALLCRVNIFYSSAQAQRFGAYGNIRISRVSPCVNQSVHKKPVSTNLGLMQKVLARNLTKVPTITSPMVFLPVFLLIGEVYEDVHKHTPPFKENSVRPPC